MTKKKSLGRGLDALLPNLNTEVKEKIIEVESGRPLNIKFSNLKINPKQPRFYFNEEELKLLSNSIKDKGIIEPLVVRKLKEKDKYELIAGERRFRAAKLAGLKEVPVIIKDIEDDPLEKLEIAIVENLFREDLNPIEEAGAYFKLENEFKKSQTEIAELTGKNRTTIANTIRLLNLPEAIKEDIILNRLSSGHGRALLTLVEDSLILEARKIVITNSLTVRQTESLVKKIKNDYEKKDEILTNFPNADKTYYEALETAFKKRFDGLKVNIKSTGKTKKIEIFYKDISELEDLMNKLSIIVE